MSGVRQGSRLEHLLELRDRVDEAIAVEEKREAVASERRASVARAAAREDERAEVARIEARAPADLVRAWAREQDIPVGDRGRLPLDLRKQYLEATHNPAGATA